MQGNSITTR